MEPVIVTKVFDEDCDICKHMSRHDRVVFEEFPEVAYQEAALDSILDHGGDLTKVRIYQCLEKHALNPDYTVDLPVYVVLDRKGKFMGHHVGAASITELREKVQAILSKEGP